jgi:hypothetical protein
MLVVERRAKMKKNISIPKGSVVTILAKDSSFEGKQGILQNSITRSKQRAKVLFGRDCSYLFGFLFNEKTAFATFPASEVRQEADFTPENKIIRLFGRNCYAATRVLKESFNPDSNHICQHKDCGRKAARRIFVNMWGVVTEFETCDVCGEEYNGKMVEYFQLEQLIQIGKK